MVNALFKSATTAVFGACLLGMTSAPEVAAAQEAVRIGTSSTGSTYYILAAGAGEIIHKYAGINSTIEPLGGSSPNIYGLGNKKIEFAVVNGFAAYSGFHGQYTFDKPIDLRLVIQGQPTYRGPIVRKGAGIKSPEDLVGKTIIGSRRALPELQLVMDAIIKAYQLPADKIKQVSTTTSPETYKALVAGSVDAAMVPFDRGAAQLEEPMQRGVVEPLYLTQEKQQEIIKLLPKAMYAETLEPNAFPGQTQPWHTFAMKTDFVVRADVPEEVVYKVVKALFEHGDEFAKYHALAKTWTLENTVSNVALPFHPGVIKYLKEVGKWTPQLEAEQQALLKR
jgi:TRAP transporter TAXI family solute receptor